MSLPVPPAPGPSMSTITSSGEDDGRIVRQMTVPQEMSGQRADGALTALLADFSREQVKTWLNNGALTLDGESVRPAFKVSGGELLALNAGLPPRAQWLPQADVEVPVVLADDDVIVINKPAGLVVHPGAGNPDGTLANRLLAEFPDLIAMPRAGIVHRLDAGTSGLLVVARSLRAHRDLVAALSDRSMGRRYYALVHGSVRGLLDIDAPIGRDPNQRLRMAVLEHGRQARTLVTPLVDGPMTTLVEAMLFSGRTHQIRVHMKHAGHPLVGDTRYGGRGGQAGALRPLLHAGELGFVHPASGQLCQFRVAPPTDFLAACTIHGASFTTVADALGADQ